MNEAIQFEVPNMECLEFDELYQLETIYARLAACAGHLKNAKRMRLKGDIEAALSSERAADNQYQQLPGWARW